MSSISSISQSGMQAAQTGLSTAAHNIANVATPGFQRQHVVQAEQAGGGVKVSISQSSALGDALAADVIRQLQARNAFLANLVMFRAGDAMAGSVLNVKA